MSRGNEFGMISSTNFLQNNWQMGEAGNKLAVNKDSEMYMTTANRIVNMLPTELGGLEVLKEHTPRSISGLPAGYDKPIIRVINTPFNFYICMCMDRIFTMNKSNQFINGYVFDENGFNRAGKLVLIDKFVLVTFPNGNRYDLEISSSGNIGLNNNFSASITNPLLHKSKVQVDIYQTRKIMIGTTEKIRPYKIRTTDLQEFLISGSIGQDGKLLFKYNKEFNITRIYYPYQSDMINMENISGLTENEWFVIIHDVDTTGGGRFYMGNSPVDFTNPKTDVTGTYYTTAKVSRSVGNTSLLSYGIMIDLWNNKVGFHTVAEFQNRMVVSNGTYIFFSKVGDYNYFLNGELDDDAFFIKLGYINGEQPIVKNFITGRGLWVVTNKGIFLIGYNSIVKGSSLDIRMIVADECGNEAVDINNTLYYTTVYNELKAIQNTTGIKGYIDFGSYYVDKFNDRYDFSSIGEFVINSKKYLYVSLSQQTKFNYTEKVAKREGYEYKDNSISVGAYIYNETNINTFARTSLQIPANLITYGQLCFGTATVYQADRSKNYDRAFIRLNIPYTYTKKYGTLLNDTTTYIEMLAVKFYDEDNKCINRLIIYDEKIDRIIKSNLDGVYSTYKYEGEKELTEPHDIIIETTRNEKQLILQGVEFFYHLGQ